MLCLAAAPALDAQTTFDFTSNASNSGSTAVTQLVSGSTINVTTSGGGNGGVLMTDAAAYYLGPVSNFSGNIFTMDLSDTVHPTTKLTITLDGGKSFDLEGLAIFDPLGAAPTRIRLTTSKGFLDTAFSSGTSSANVLSFIGESSLQGVTSVTITRQDNASFYFALDNIVLNNIISPPDAPTGVSAIAGIGMASVTFTAPAFDGGAAITMYTATATPGGATGSCSGPSACAISFPGLTNGTSYTFTVQATNSIGTGPASAASNAVTPKASQTITFANPGARNFDTTPTLTATASSGLAPTFTSSTTGVCTVTTGGIVTFVAAGTCVINVNQAGNGNFFAATQVSQSFTVNAVVPGPPTAPRATAGNTQATVTFTAPSSNGGVPITQYIVTANPDGATATGASSPITVTGLTNGTSYTFTVTATNSVGTGVAQGASNAVTPKTDQTITFANPGAQNFGTTPTVTATASSGLAPTYTSSTTTVCTISSSGVLAFVTAGTCTINADQAGNATFFAAPRVSQSFSVNPVVPGAPRTVAATAGNTQATVTFTAPSSNGGAAVTQYTVTANPGGATATGGSSPITVTGLTNGTSYKFTVTATNPAGTGADSSASSAVTPKGNQTITFANPGAQNFGTTPTLTATASSGSTPTFTSSTASVCRITSAGVLTFVTVGTCTINADTAENSSFLAAPRVSQSFPVTAVVPGAPTIGTATASNALASVTFTAPSFNGGATITRYTATATPGGATATGASSPITVTGLTNGTSYTFTLTAANSAGTGAPSGASNAVTPKGTQTITFANPGTQNLGTTPTLTATSSSGLAPTFTSSTASVCTITTSGALTLVKAGTCTIAADQAGNGSFLPASQVSRSFPVGAVAPDAPAIGLATAGATQATVAFTPPSFDGGATITLYTVTANPGGATATGTSSPITVMKLTNGTSYTFTVKATSSAGIGAASAPSNAVTPKGPQTIAFPNPDPPTFGTKATLKATASSGLAPSFTSSTPSVCTITSDGALTLVSAGTCTIKADQAGNDSFAPAPQVTCTFTVNKAPQAIVFGALANRVLGGGSASFDVRATGGGSGKPVVFSSNTPDICTVSGNAGTVKGAGLCTIVANQDGNSNFAAAVPVTRSFVVACSGKCHASSVPYSIDKGGSTFVPEGTPDNTQPVAFGRLLSADGGPLPYGFAIMGYRENGVLVAEAGMPGVEPVLSGRLFAEVNGPIMTGIAFANPGTESVTVSFFFTDQNGASDKPRDFVLGPKSKIARFINEAPFNSAKVFTGTMTFTATSPVGVASIRGLVNERNTFTYALQTVSPIVAVAPSPVPSVVMAHFADGTGWTTQVLLVNTGDLPTRGTVQFIGEGSGSTPGAPLKMTVNGKSGLSFDYSIPARASLKLETPGTGTTIQIGSVRVTPALGSIPPSGYTLFAYRKDGVTVSQASVAAQSSASAFRMYVESIGASQTSGPIRSGVAIANVSATPATVLLELTSLNGTGQVYTQSIQVPGNGHLSKFIEELIPGASLPSRGILRVSSQSGQLVVTGLRMRTNERGELLATTMPAIDEGASSSGTEGHTGELVFPHVVDRGAYTTQFILFNSTPSQTSVGTVEFYDENGKLVDVTY
jgi:hypothetical protein